jgi:hypothetical protein
MWILGVFEDKLRNDSEKYQYLTNDPMGWVILEVQKSDFHYVWDKWRDGLDPSLYNGEIVFNEFIRFMGELHPDGRFGTKGHSTSSQQIER